MTDILKLNPISDMVSDILCSGCYNVTASSTAPEAVLVRSFNMCNGYELPASVRVVARAGAGYNNIPYKAYAEKGVVVMNTPGANANAVKELVIASMFLASRNLKRAMNWVDSLKGTEGVAAAVEKNKSAFVGPELMGKTLGLIGLGAIGRAVAAAATALGMRVIGFDPYLAPQMLSALPSSAQCVGCMDELFSTCDYISLHAPLTPDTKYCVCEGAIAKMKKGVILINCARGELVDNAALIAAVKEGKIAAYVTDFPTEELLGIDNVIAIPHLGASTPEAEDNCAVMAAAQIKDYLENGNIVNSVYLPNLKKARTKARRMVALGTVDVSKIFPVVDCDVASASANGYYYSICDFSGEPGKVCSLPEGVMFVREV